MGFSMEAWAAKQVVIIGTIHGDHDRYPLFNFETLRIAIEHIKPDLVIVEEDPKTFKDKWYETLSEEEYERRRPIEIKKVVMPYVLKNNLKAIPVDDRAEFDEKNKALDDKMNQEMKNDPEKKKAAVAMFKSYESLFLDGYLNRTIYDFQSDTFMAVIEQHSELTRLHPLTKESQALSDRRQEKINANIVSALKKENFKRALIVYGVSHRPAIVRAIQKSEAAEIVSLEAAMKPRLHSFFERKGSFFLGDK